MAMSKLHLILLGLHVFAQLFWVGSLVSITRIMGAAQGEAEAVRARLASTARHVYRTVSSPWMGVALLTGLAMIAHNTLYFRMPWFHGKLTAAIVMLALHFVIGARVRGAEAQGLNDDAARSMRGLQLGVLLAALGAVLTVVVQKNWH
jgi:uncharacterized membrane protein